MHLQVGIMLYPHKELLHIYPWMLAALAHILLSMV
jgi:hypothetical protein